jgi:hypothetical protein
MSTLSMPRTIMPDPYICGSTFNNLEEARDTLVRCTVARGLSYHVRSSDRQRKYILDCRSKACQFRLRVSIAKSGTAQTTLSAPHSCPPGTHEGWRPASSTKYLLAKHQGTYERGDDITPKDISDLERLDGNHISYKQSWRAHRMAKARQGLGWRDPNKYATPEPSFHPRSPGPPALPPSRCRSPSPQLPVNEADKQPPRGLELEELQAWERRNLSCREMLKRQSKRNKLIEDAREGPHIAWIEDFRKEHGRFPGLHEDPFGEGLEMFTNRLVPRYQRR